MEYIILVCVGTVLCMLWKVYRRQDTMQKEIKRHDDELALMRKEKEWASFFGQKQ